MKYLFSVLFLSSSFINQSYALTVDESKLLQCSKSGDFECVRKLLEKNVDITVTKHNGQNALHIASFNGHVDIVKILLQQAPDKSYVYLQTKNEKQSAFFIAVTRGHIEICKTLLKFTKDHSFLFLKNRIGISPLLIAIAERQTKIVEFLINLDDSLEHLSISMDGNFTPLHMAVDRQDRAIINLLLNNQHASKLINLRDKNNETPLLMALDNFSPMFDSIAPLVAHSPTHEFLFQQKDNKGSVIAKAFRIGLKAVIPIYNNVGPELQAEIIEFCEKNRFLRLTCNFLKNHAKETSISLEDYL